MTSSELLSDISFAESRAKDLFRVYRPLLAAIGLIALTAGSLFAIDALPKKVLPGQRQSTIPANADADYELLPRLVPSTTIIINDREGYLRPGPIVSTK